MKCFNKQRFSIQKANSLSLCNHVMGRYTKFEIDCSHQCFVAIIFVAALDISTLNSVWKSITSLQRDGYTENLNSKLRVNIRFSPDSVHVLLLVIERTYYSKCIQT